MIGIKLSEDDLSVASPCVEYTLTKIRLFKWREVTEAMKFVFQSRIRVQLTASIFLFLSVCQSICVRVPTYSVIDAKHKGDTYWTN